ncbi:MAG: DMT family transporter [Phycisphaerae bacterium]|nr:DMT family transporter [Phycisphaerae bacterium]
MDDLPGSSDTPFGRLVHTARGIPRAASSATVRHMRRWEGVLVLGTTLACWSSVSLFLKHLSDYMDHWTSNGWRYGASALFWLPAVVWALTRGTLPRSIWRAALVPAIFNTAGQVVFTSAHYFVSPGVVTFGLRVQVVAVAIGAYLLFPKERALIRKPLYLTGLVILLAGVAVVVAGGDELLNDASRTGVWMSISAGIGFALYGLSVRRFMYGYHPIYAFGVIALYTGSALVVCMLIWGENHGAAVLHLQSAELWHLGLSAFLGIALGHVLYYTAIDRLGVATTAGVLQLQPFIVSVASVLLFGITLTALQWSGGVVALIGAAFLLLTQRAMERRARAG